jgi:hypothetical protein
MKRASLLLVPMLTGLFLGCGGEIEWDDLRYETLESALNNVDARIDLYIQAEYNDASRPLQLCIGDDSHCYSLVPACLSADGKNHASQPRTCILVTDTAGSDHPLVAHPDAWDSPYIRNPSSRYYAGLYALRITFEYRGHPAGAWRSHLFMDVDFPDDIIIRPGGRAYMDRWVRMEREAQVEMVSGINFHDLPWMIRQGAYDLGQVGIVKYKPWDTSGQNGCDEFYNFFASQFSNNILYSCRDHTCSFFRNWTTGGGFDSLHRDQFGSADRLYKMEFNHTGGVRTSIRGIFKCGNPTCTWLDRSIRYTPKIGDLFLEDRPSDPNFHAMMVLGEFVDQSAGGNVAFDLGILHKSTAVMANTANYTHATINDTSGGAFRHHFYFGESDHDRLVEVDGGLTSGSRPWEMGPNSGFRSTLLTIVSQ